jgi:hypothetical protein
VVVVIIIIIITKSPETTKMMTTTTLITLIIIMIIIINIIIIIIIIIIFFIIIIIIIITIPLIITVIIFIISLIIIIIIRPVKDLRTYKLQLFFEKKKSIPSGGIELPTARTSRQYGFFREMRKDPCLRRDFGLRPKFFCCVTRGGLLAGDRSDVL